MIKITHDMLGAYEVIAAGILGSYFHPDLGEMVKDLITGDYNYLENVSDYFNTENYLKMLTYDYRYKKLETNMLKIDLICPHTNPDYDFADMRFYVFKYEDGTEYEDHHNMIYPIAIIAD